MKLIVGLGNPGRRYRATRHNIGFMFVDEIAKEHKLKFSLDKALKAEVVSFNIDDEKIILIKPQTYMNLSGSSVLAVSNYFKVEHEDILIVYDDLDLPTGKIRIRKSGTSGGHKGMQNIIDLLKTNDIKRLRIGIMNNSQIDTIDYVLGKFTETELASINLTLEKANIMFKSFIKDEFDDFMNKFNRNGLNE